MNAPAKRAQFDAGDKQRRLLIAKVHVAKRDLALSDDDYRAVLVDVTGRMSAGDCTEAQLVQVLKRFEARGFTTRPATRGPKRADHPSARKARALWISLHQLGAIDDPSERALEAMARRQLHIDRLQWADQAMSYRLIEALKAIGQRHGWDQSTEGVPVANVPVVLRRRLVEAIVAKLKQAGLVPGDWLAERAAFDLAGIECRCLWTTGTEDLELIAGALGAKLREARGLR